MFPGITGKKDCQKCHGEGGYQYSQSGTPHFKPCELCCPHKQGFWLLKESYGKNNGKHACLGGCGALQEELELEANG